MRAIRIVVLGLALSAACGPAAAQTFNARRMAMGGVVLGGSGANVAYRAVPRPEGGARTLSLPLGLIPVLLDPPQLNPRRPDFNVYDLANLLYTAPWNLQLTSPDPPSSDVVVSISKDSLAVDLGDVADVFQTAADAARRQGASVTFLDDAGIAQPIEGLAALLRWP